MLIPEISVRFVSSLLVFASFASSSAAAPGDIVLTLTGQAYDGPPAFVLKFNGEVIGSGTVANAIDPSKDGPLGDRPIEPYLQTFHYKVPDGAFVPTGKIEVEFLNDAYGGEGLDRNLIIHSVSVNGRTAEIGEFTTIKQGVEVANDVIGGQLVLYTSDRVAIVAAPAEGWPGATSVAAEVRTEEGAATEVAVVQPEPAPPACPGGSAVVMGYERGFTDIQPAQAVELQALMSSMPSGVCAVEVAGYSSVGGGAELNLIVAEARATAVLRYLKENGAQFLSEKVIPFGETRQFGPTDAENRRVVVTLVPGASH